MPSINSSNLIKCQLDKTLEIIPAPDETLIKEYIKFSNRINPYEKMDENFPNPWFFNEDNRLESIAGKFAEPSVWYDYIKNFFETLGYKVNFGVT